MRKESFLHAFRASALNPDVKVVSFDFFDTIMSRRVAKPADLFVLLGKSIRHLLAFDVTPERFAQLRAAAEERARSQGATREIDIHAIYRQFPEGFFKEGVELDTLVEAELAQEAKSLFPLSYIVELMQDLAVRGKRIVVVSDTYLTAAHLKRLWGNSAPGVDITFFASSEYGTGKYAELFPRVLKKLKIKGNEMVHVGDNYGSDVKTPASQGVRAHLLPHGSGLFWNLWADEVSANHTASERQHPELGDFGLTALRAKVCVHLSAAGVDNPNHVLYGAQVLGPALAVFAAWVRACAKESGISDVLPLMREGHMITQLLNQYADEDLSVCPTYLSRRLLFQAGLANASVDDLRNLRFGNLESSVEDYLKLINLRLTDVPALRSLARKGLNDDATFEAVIAAIRADNTAMDLIRQRGADVRQGILRHLETLCPGISDTELAGVQRIAVVDVGWNGTIQRLLQQLLDDAGWKVEIHGYYMMTTPAVVQLAMDGVLAKGLFIDAGLPTTEYGALSRTLEIFEQSCAPAHGSVLNHDLLTGEPRVMPDRIPARQRGDILDIQEGMAMFNEMFISYLQASGQLDVSATTLADIAPQLLPVLRRAMCTPTPAEVRLFMHWMHDDNLASGAALPILGSDLNRERVRYQSVAQFLRTQMNELYWPFGALALAAPARTKMLSKILVNKLAPEFFDQQLDISSEFAGSASGRFDDAVAAHQGWVRNTEGLSYLRFELAQGDLTSLRWTFAPVATELEVGFIVLTFKPADGRPVAQVRVEGSDLSYYATLRNVVCVDAASARYRTKGGNGAMYFTNLRELGIDGEGSLQVEVGAKVCAVDAVDDGQVGATVLSTLPESVRARKVVNGMAAKVDAVNGRPLESKGFVAPVGVNLLLSGWAFDSGLKGDGTVLLRLTSPAGESRFVVADRTQRPDVNKHYKTEGATGFQVILPATGSAALPVGAYMLSVMLASGEGKELAIGSEHLQIVIQEKAE